MLVDEQEEQSETLTEEQKLEAYVKSLPEFRFIPFFVVMASLACFTEATHKDWGTWYKNTKAAVVEFYTYRPSASEPTPRPKLMHEWYVPPTD